jgi:hypothetical protein
MQKRKIRSVANIRLGLKKTFKFVTYVLKLLGNKEKSFTILSLGRKMEEKNKSHNY